MDAVPSSEAPTSTPIGVGLQVLTPVYEAKNHSAYVELVKQAIGDPKVRNIAITGPYGTGKSSILSRVAEDFRHRVVELSLYTGGQESDEPAGDGAPRIADTTTNRIQKEIVKQLLYKERPSKTRASRFRRIRRFVFWPAAGVSVLCAFIVTGILFITGWGTPLVAGVGTETVAVLLGYLGLMLIMAAAFVLIAWLTQGRIFLERVTAGPTSITLSADSTSFFDQYLDEIVYYFEVSGHDIVIFEDMDRFDAVYIFETLRALNLLINGAQQVRKRPIKGADNREDRPPVKFIYALRDSVFDSIAGAAADKDQSDAARSEVRLANRTKFFDQVIPVIPFITHRNARDLMSTMMAGTGVSPGLISLAGRHVADMRLIKNMRTEYDVFAQGLLHVAEPLPDLTPDQLFAMILYKNLHLADFERIRLGESDLDTLYERWRELVSACSKRQSEEIQRLDEQLHLRDSAAEWSDQLGLRLHEVATAIATGNGARRTYAVIIAGNERSGDDLRSPDLWSDIVKDELDLTVQVRSSNSAVQASFPIQFAGLPAFLGCPVDADRWAEDARAKLIKDRTAALERREFLRHHTWAQLWQRPEFTLDTNDGADHAKPKSFAALAGGLLKSQLARDLVAHGYINAYFALCVSPYYGKHLSRDALQYILRSVNPGRPEMFTSLSSDDVEAIIVDQGAAVLQDKSMLNVSVVDHLLANPARFGPILNTLRAWDTDATDFVSEYLTHGQQKGRLIAALTPHVRTIFVDLASWPLLEHGVRTELFDIALSSSAAGTDYVLTGTVRNFINANYRDFTSLTGKDAPAGHSQQSGALVGRTQARLESLAALNRESLAVIVKARCYAVTAANLKTATDSDDIALDTIKFANLDSGLSGADIYAHALAEAGDYVAALKSVTPPNPSVRQAAHFCDILTDAAKAIPTSAGPANDSSTTPTVDPLWSIIELAAPACSIKNLADAPVEAWEPLVDHKRVPATFVNVSAYADHTGEIDRSLAELLSEAEEITSTIDDPLDGVELAKTIVKSKDTLAAPALRVSLIASIHPRMRLAPGDVPSEPGELVGLLIKSNVLPDEAATFATPPISDWPTREFAIRQSSNFVDFMTPSIIPAEQLPDFLKSSFVPPEAKGKVFDSLSDYCEMSTPAVATAVAEYGAANAHKVTVPNLTFLIERGADAEAVATLMANALPPTDELLGVLRQLGGDYAVIADPGARRPAFEATAAHRAILDRLQEEGPVSSYRAEDSGRQLRVSMQHT